MKDEKLLLQSIFTFVRDVTRKKRTSNKWKEPTLLSPEITNQIYELLITLEIFETMSFIGKKCITKKDASARKKNQLEQKQKSNQKSNQKLCSVVISLYLCIFIRHNNKLVVNGTNNQLCYIVYALAFRLGLSKQTTYTEHQEKVLKGILITLERQNRIVCK